VVTVDGTTITGYGTLSGSLSDFSTINANVSGETLTLDGGGTITNDGLWEATGHGILDVDSAVDNTHGSIYVGAGSSADFADNVSSGKATVEAGGVLTYGGMSNVATTLENTATTYSELILGDPQQFSGTITGFTGTGASTSLSDTIDLTDFNPHTVDLVSAIFNKHDDVTTLTVTDDGQTAALKFTGDYSLSQFQHAADSSGTGTDIFDPAESASSDSTASTDSGATFTIRDGAGAPENAIQVNPNTPTIEAVTNVDGSISDFMLGNDQINLASGQTATDTYTNVTVPDPGNPGSTVNTMSVTVGGPGNDNFVFTPGIGADTITNFNPQAETIELDNFANVQNAQQLAAAITTDAHGDAVIELGHSDSVTIPGVSATYLQQHLTNLVHLH
jgi:hypothetical protein